MLHLTDIAEQAGSDRLFARYGQVDSARYDEAFDSTGTPRPSWLGMLDWLRLVGRAGYQDAAQDLQRLRTESGIAFAASRKTGEVQTDALPVILSGADWATLSAGIEQRARLADAAVKDAYTTRRMINGGLIPPGLLHGGPAFAAHCAGWERPPMQWVHIYEADVARRADGSWVILADRLDAPLGDGWLLANRVATTQAFAEPFVDIGVRRVAGHFAAFQDHLDQMMGWEGRLALLTGGKRDPRFFSHAYLARYMNATLIEPADLTVRDGSAFVKTLSGLKRIDVLLRGVPDAAIDSLHRPGRAAFGAPALSLAARSGSLKIANAIGSAAFAYRALAPYAHRLAQHLLGEELLLSDAPCLWLGGAKARDEVLADRDAWRIEPLTSDAGAPLSWVEDEDPNDTLADRLARVGERLCAVQTPALSQTPVWHEDGIRPGEWMMRVFACRTADGWSVAPSGVASVVQPGHPPPALGFGKDVWVLPDPGDTAPQISLTNAPHLADSHLRRTGSDLLSRVADEVFWLGRNAERAESVLRVLATCLARHLGGNRTDAGPDVLNTLIGIHVDRAIKAKGIERYLDGMHRLTRDTEDAMSVPAILSLLSSGALRARAAISEESWRYIDRLCSDRRWPLSGPVRQTSGLSRLIEDSLQALAAFAGSAQENLTRNFTWRFLEIGRRIERGSQIALMAERLAGPVRDSEETYLRAWLTLGDSNSAYRSRYMMVPRAAAVIDLLILDETNPRALAFQIARLEQVLAELPSDIPYRRPEHRLALSLLTDLRLMDADVLAMAKSGKRGDLVAFAKRCQKDLAEISDLIARAFFAHSEAPEALMSQARNTPDTQSQDQSQ